jgi:NADH dehydrogenase
MSDSARPSVLILGAGFAGVGVAQGLLQSLPEEERWDITLVDENNFLLFTPMLTEVAGGNVDPAGTVAAIRSLVPGVHFVQGRVESIDAANRSARVTVGGNASGIPPLTRTLSADHLVIALGSTTNFHHIDGVAEHSLTVKSVTDAETIRNRAIALLERASEEPDGENRRALLAFVVGGGGFSGVETVAALNDMVRGLVQDYPPISPDDVQMIVVQPGERLLPEISARLASYAQTELESRGVRVMLDTLVTGAGAGYVDVKHSDQKESNRIAAHTLIWAGGVKPSPVIDSAGLQLGRHHGIAVDACCRVSGHPGLWALGDCAEVPKPGGNGATYAPTAQNATREGAQVARNIIASVHGEAPQPFVYHPIGELAVVGRRAAVASVYGMQFSGIVAWAMWRAIYLAKLPTWPKRVRVGLDWMLDAVTGRDIADLPGAGDAAAAGAQETKQTSGAGSH